MLYPLICAFKQCNAIAVRIAEIHLTASVFHCNRRLTVQPSLFKLRISLIQAAARVHQINNTSRMLAPFVLVPDNDSRQLALKSDLCPVTVTETFKRNRDS
ncbi:hypothetical protein D3C80_1754360 [compost metagenome]